MLGGLSEFNSAVRHDTDLICVICNDGAYGAELVHLQDRNLPDDIARFAWPDFVPLAEALGGRGISVRDTGDLAHMRAAIADRDRPLLIDLKLDADQIPRVGQLTRWRFGGLNARCQIFLTRRARCEQHHARDTSLMRPRRVSSLTSNREIRSDTVEVGLRIKDPVRSVVGP